MNIRIEDISESYFDHLYYSPGKSKSALVIPLSSRKPESISGTLKVLDIIKGDGTEWIFSFWGKIFPGSNGSVLGFISKHEDQLTYVVSEISKYQENFISSSFEISISINLDTFNEMLVTGEFDFSRDFRLAGWLVPSGTKNLFLKNSKWIQGRFLFPSELTLAFCSGEDWEAMYVYASNENIVKEVLKKISN